MALQKTASARFLATFTATSNQSINLGGNLIPSEVPLMNYLGTDSVNSGIELELKVRNQGIVLPAWLYVLWCEPGYLMSRVRKVRKRAILVTAWLHILWCEPIYPMSRARKVNNLLSLELWGKG